MCLCLLCACVFCLLREYRQNCHRRKKPQYIYYQRFVSIRKIVNKMEVQYVMSNVFQTRYFKFDLKFSVYTSILKLPKGFIKSISMFTSIIFGKEKLLK